MKPSDIILDRLNPKYKKYISKSYLRELDKEVYNNTRCTDIDFNNLKTRHNRSGLDISIDAELFYGKLPLKKRYDYLRDCLNKSPSDVTNPVVRDSYSQDLIFDKFRKGKCLECDTGVLSEHSTSIDSWTEFYRCDSCNTLYEFQETDMGQTMPFLDKIDNI